MPWKVRSAVNERMRFVVRREQGERMTDLCREFGISRKTGYKLWNRYQRFGPEGLYDGSRKPLRVPKQTPEDIQKRILAFKGEHPTWGAKKLKVELERRNEGVVFPSVSTINLLLQRNGLVKKRKKRRRATPSSLPLKVPEKPNDVWGADFKGEFRLGNGKYCYPLTITDQHSRYLIGCEGLESTKGTGARFVFEQAFRKYGLPHTIRTDNGSPFASTGLLGLTRLSVWWMRLGIRHERIEPGHPEQNGRHERLHLTLKEETTRPAAQNMLQQQECFDNFLDIYNNQRPHEALGMSRPAEVYCSSMRAYPEELHPLEYPLHDQTRKVRPSGHISLFGRKQAGCYLSAALAGEYVGLRELDEDRWLISFLDLDLGVVKGNRCRLEPIT